MIYLSLISCSTVASIHTFMSYPAEYIIRNVRSNSCFSLLRNKFYYILYSPLCEKNPIALTHISENLREIH